MKSKLPVNLSDNTIDTNSRGITEQRDTNDEKNRQLMEAVTTGNVSRCKELIEGGADLKFKDQFTTKRVQRDAESHVRGVEATRQERTTLKSESVGVFKSVPSTNKKPSNHSRT
jgi:hypothetical protein